MSPSSRIGRTVRPLVAALALGAAVLAAPAAAPGPALGVGPLPACRLDDVLTAPRDYDSWSTTLVDWILTVGPDYKPPDLVSISRAGVTGGGLIRELALDDLKAMADAARAHGTPLGNVSSYRSYNQQRVLFNSYVNGYGYNRAITFSARPGHSEHQLGLTIDFAPGGQSVFVNEETGAGAWLSKNAWKYGWLMSYPKGKKPVTCYRYEPWHYRYVGRDLAAKIHASGLTTREYLWANFTTAKVPPASPGASGPPASAQPSAPAGSSESPGTTASAAPTSTPAGSQPSTSAGPTGTPRPTAPSSPAGALLDPVVVAIIALALVLAAVVALRSFRPSAGRPSRR